MASVRLSSLPTMPPRARAVILRICEQRGVVPLQVVNSCRVQKVYYARKEIAQALLTEFGCSSTQIGRWLNHDHTTILFYLGLLKRKPRPERAPRPPRKRVWKAPRVRHVRWLTTKARPANILSLQRYAGYDPSENQIAL